MRAALALLLVLALAPAAHAQQRTASTSDPQGDSSGDATDFASLQASYDPAGSLQVVLGYHAPLKDTVEVIVDVYPASRDQCVSGTGAIGQLRIHVNQTRDGATASYLPDDGTSLDGSAALSGDGRTLSIAFGPDPAIAGREFACTVASGEEYSDGFTAYEGDRVYVDFPGYERPECSDGKDNDADGRVDSADSACTDDIDDAEALGRTPTLTRKRARQAAILAGVVRGTDYAGLKVRCRKRSRLVARCRARGAHRGTADVRRKRVGDHYEDRVSRWRIRRR